MGLHPMVKHYLETSPPNPYDQIKTDYVKIRKWYEAAAPLADQVPPVQKVEDRVIPGPAGSIPIRIYTPDGNGPHPMLVFLHGGGFVIGSIADYDFTCRKLARATGHKVISVEYRLAPEHPFPAPPEDCYAAVQWVAAHAVFLNGNPEKLSVAGTSAGGNLSAVTALMCRDRGGPKLYKQVLIYPVTDYFESSMRSPYPSYESNSSGYNLTSKAMDGFWSLYVNNPSLRCHPYAAPIRAESLGSLPPALIITAEFDPVRDEGEQYGERLRSYGVSVETVRYDGMIHGFLKFTNSAEAMDVYRRIGKFLA